MNEQIRLVLFAVLLVSGLVIQITATVGINRFRFSVNRMHPAGMGDSLGLLLTALAAILYTGLNAASLKIILILAVYWITSPVCTHLVSRMVAETQKDEMKTEAKEWRS